MKKLFSQMSLAVGLACIASSAMAAPIGGGSSIALNGDAVTVGDIVAVNLDGKSPFKVDISAPDESGKGTAQVALNVPDGNLLCASGVGDLWARAGSKLSADKSFCAPISNGSATVTIAVGGTGTMALVWFITDQNRTIKAYAGHPYAASRNMMVQANGKRDLATILTHDATGFRMPTAEEVASYAEWYKEASRTW